jgi:hypothetical protein
MVLFAIMDGDNMVRSKNFGNAARVYSSEGRARAALEYFQRQRHSSMYPNADNFRIVKFIEAYDIVGYSGE